ncbi:Abi family protein [Megasphaera hexanoica]|uniref:Abi family protein n=1 Tax=Megasphaera hexanoica TaxID=1675036 RepID=A0ABW7DRQ0_9FIRM
MYPLKVVIAYKNLSKNIRDSVDSVLFAKRLYSADELVKHMQSKGITFNYLTIDEAKHFLMEHNYYFKFAAYRSNYDKVPKGPLKGQYKSLDFSYLKELSIIDMHLRYLILDMCLDIEHQLKVMLINDIMKNPDEDGYNIINLADEDRKNRSNFYKRIDTSYSSSLIKKYQPPFFHYPIWAYCELVDFGGLCKLYKTYLKTYPNRRGLPKYNFLYPIRNLRNASAHSNCLINKIPSNSGNVNADINNIVARIPTISTNSRLKYLRVQPIHDFTVLLFWYSTYVKSEGLQRTRKKICISYSLKECSSTVIISYKIIILHMPIYFVLNL